MIVGAPIGARGLSDVFAMKLESIVMDTSIILGVFGRVLVAKHDEF